MKWIKFDLKKQIPSLKQNKEFLVTNGKETTIARWHVDFGGDGQLHWWFHKDFKYIENITHWMPLPLSPQKE